MIYYKIQAKEESSAKQIVRTLKNSRTWVRSNGESLELYSATGNDHVSHVRGIAQQFNAVAVEIQKIDIPASIRAQGGIPKREYTAFDGTIFSDKTLFAQYERSKNPKNIENRQAKVSGTDLKPRASRCKTIGRLEPNTDFNLQGVITSLKALEDRLLCAYNEISELRPKLEKIQDYDKLLQDRDDYLKSARAVLASR